MRRALRWVVRGLIGTGLLLVIWDEISRESWVVWTIEVGGVLVLAGLITAGWWVTTHREEDR